MENFMTLAKALGADEIARGVINYTIPIQQFGVTDRNLTTFPINLKEIPDIVDFKQIQSWDNESGDHCVVSIMKFADGTETKAKCAFDSNDMYTGFVTCYCKKILGNDFNKTITYWTEKKPAQDAKEQDKKLKEAEERKVAEQRRIDKAKRRKYKRMVKQKEMEIMAEREVRNRLDGNI